MYRADFYCAAARLVIEVDGMAHDMGDRPAKDVARTAALEARGVSGGTGACGGRAQERRRSGRRDRRICRPPPPPSFGWSPSPRAGRV
ncbi:endonuclease domain-containing protein [uncultured Sphingomonas sp.]|uniref:endonuclease domain-containing protein n=1 Tax=uncultured Sphingomonas sp. TaxID=158754 RepID=UPI0035CC9782